MSGAKWTALAIVTLAVAYIGTGFMNVCEVRVVPMKLLLTPAVAVIAAISAYVVAGFGQGLRVLGVVAISAAVGQAVGYTWPWICF